MTWERNCFDKCDHKLRAAKRGKPLDTVAITNSIPSCIEVAKSVRYFNFLLQSYTLHTVCNGRVDRTLQSTAMEMTQVLMK